MLSWLDVRGAGQTAAQGYNVVIHEFAHVLDMADGVADACRCCRLICPGAIGAGP